MSVAASVGSSVGRAVASSVARTAGGFDSDALAYFAAVEAAGGSFDLTGVNAAYTSSYVKQAHSDLFAGLKTDSLWTKITELYLLSGKTYAGMAIKAKHSTSGTGVVYNSNFSAGVDSWLGVNSPGMAGNIDGIDGEDDCLRVTAPSSLAYRITYGSRVVGVHYRMRCDVYIPSSNSHVDGVFFRGLGSQQIFTPTPDTWVTIESEGLANDIIFQIAFADGGGDAIDPGGDDVVYIKNCVFTNEGPKTLTLTNFVSGDYVSAGSGAGLLSAATKQISTNFAFAGGVITDSSLGVYVTSNNGSTSYNNWIGANGGDAINTRLSIAQQSGTQVGFENSGFASGGRPIGIPTVTTTGHFVCTRRTSTDAEGYRNGGSVSTNTASDTDTNSGTIILFNGGVARISASHIGTGLTDTDASNLSTRINAFMTALGANVY